MERETIKIEEFKESFVKIKHKTGLTILLKQMKDFSTAIAVFLTRFGSVDRCFKKVGEKEKTTVPDGVAHYLEHKLFENEDGSVTFELFSKEKALANAETSFNSTSYYFSSPSKNFLDALKILLNFVQNPYFTDENVEKERGIISQEIKMEKDTPEEVVFYKCLEGMYKNSAVKIYIGGSVSSIKKINKEILYECYNNFYNLSNMCLILVGNFNEEEALSLVDAQLKNAETVEIERFYEEEPEEVEKKYCEVFMPVKMPLFSIGFKLTPKKGEQRLKTVIGLRILCELLLGEGSFLYNEFYENGLVFGAEVGFNILDGENFLTLILNGESENPKEVMNKIFEEIVKMKVKGINEKEFLLVKKLVYKEYLEEFSTPEKVAYFLEELFIKKDLQSKNLSFIKEYYLKDLENCLNEINLNKTNLTVVLPLKQPS